MNADKSPLKILMLVTRLNIGGPAVQVATLAANLPDASFKATLACGRPGEREGDMSYIAGDMGIHPLVIPELSREISPINDIRALFKIVGLIDRIRPDILHTHTAKAGTLGRAAAILVNATRPSGKRIKIVHTFHGHTFHSYFGRLKTTLFTAVERLLAKFTDRIIVISPLQRDDICHTYGIAPERKVRVIRLGFDLQKFSGGAPAKNDSLRSWFPETTPKRFLVGIVGRLTHVKNPRMLLDVAKIIQGETQSGEFGFLMIGDGDLKSNLMQETRKRGLGNMVKFTGWQKDTPGIYRSLDAVVLTSLNEGTPVSLIEAMASGKPVIATDVGGVRDLMGGFAEKSDSGFQIMKNGILVEAEDAEAMASALLRLKNARSVFTNKAKAARQSVIKRYATERIIDDMTALYRQLG